MQAGDTYVVEAFDMIAHDLGGDDRFLGYLLVRGAPADDEDVALIGRVFVDSVADDTRGFVEDHSVDAVLQGYECVSVGPGDQ